MDKARVCTPIIASTLIGQLRRGGGHLKDLVITMEKQAPVVSVLGDFLDPIHKERSNHRRDTQLVPLGDVWAIALLSYPAERAAVRSLRPMRNR